MAGLFETPEEVRARIGKTGAEQDLSLAGMSGTQAANYGGAMAGRLFGQAIGGAMGYEDPQIAKAKKLQKIMGGIDASNPYDGLLRGAKELMSEYPAEAIQMITLADKFKPIDAKPGEISNLDEYKLPTGDVVRAFLDRNQRRMIYRDASGAEQFLPYGAVKITPSSTGREKMTPNDLLKLRTDMVGVENGVKKIANYMKKVGNSPMGLQLLADKWVGKIKTIFGNDLSPANLNALQQNGQLQSLLGRFRKEVVGGGVMTEQDALRVIAALGGEVDATRHPEVVRRLLSEIVQAKVGEYNSSMLPMYEDQRTRGGAYKSKLSPITVPEIFTKPITPVTSTEKSINDMSLEEVNAEIKRLESGGK